jgi:hypothetical protein
MRISCTTSSQLAVVPRSQIDVELQPHAHRRELDVQVLQHARHSDHANVIPTRPAHTLSIHPHIALTRDAIRRPRTPPTPHREIRILAFLPLILIDGRRGAEERSTLTANRRFSVVGAVHEAVLQEESRAVGDERVTLHFTDADAAALFAPFDGLACHRVYGTCGTDLELRYEVSTCLAYTSYREH